MNKYFGLVLLLIIGNIFSSGSRQLREVYIDVDDEGKATGGTIISTEPTTFVENMELRAAAVAAKITGDRDPVMLSDSSYFNCESTKLACCCCDNFSCGCFGTVVSSRQVKEDIVNDDADLGVYKFKYDGSVWARFKGVPVTQNTVVYGGRKTSLCVCFDRSCRSYSSLYFYFCACFVRYDHHERTDSMDRGDEEMSVEDR